jgi:hypothetical protein
VAIPGQKHASPSDQDGEVVRMTSKGRSSGRIAILYLALALVIVAASAAYLLGRKVPGGSLQPAGSQELKQADILRSAPAGVATDRVARPRGRVAPPPSERLHEDPFEVPSLDPDDVATYIRPDDPEPSAAELIEALHHAGIRSGIGAFNPPGTSPLLEGLVVPEDYDVPEGFVRHHQVTDQGEPLEPILLFSPDYEFFDAAGRPIRIPDNRVVPPEHAPPDMPIQPVQPPPPP